MGTLRPMNKTPLKSFLEKAKVSAASFSREHGFSAWSVRHWTRGDKLPALRLQTKLEIATQGAVRPADWLEWKLSRMDASQ